MWPILAAAAAVQALVRVDVTAPPYSAVGDGATNNTAASRRAVAAIARAGGGTLVVPAGRFLTGAFNLSSHTTLQIQAGGVVAGTTDSVAPPETELSATIATRAKEKAVARTTVRTCMIAPWRRSSQHLTERI